MTMGIRLHPSKPTSKNCSGSFRMCACLYFAIDFFSPIMPIYCLSNAKQYNSVGSIVHDAAVKSQAVLHNMIHELKERMIQVAKKSFAKASSKPNSTVAALVERNNRLKLKRSLAPSSATLLVVPSVLLEHWQVRPEVVFQCPCRRHISANCIYDPIATI